MEPTEHLAAQLRSLPSRPGVYQYYDSEGNLLYVGKAKNLKNRVGSYFNRQTYESGKTLVLVRKIADIRTIVVESEMDALLLENSLIKKHKPRYNINLKDDKTYPSIVIRKEEFPRVFATRQVMRDGSEYFGPYTSARNMHAVLDLVRRLYPIRNCSLPLTPSNIAAGKFKVCLEYHLGNCLGPCEGKQSAEEYEASVQQIRRIIRGNYGETLREMKQHLREYTGRLEFEKAQEIKEKIALLEGFQSRSTVVNASIHNVDVFTVASDSQSGFVNYLKVNNGAIVQSYTLELRKRMDESDLELLALAIVDIREKFQSQSEEVYVPFDPGIEWPGVRFHIPQKGDKKKLLDLSYRNALHSMEEERRQQEIMDPDRHSRRILETLKQDLRLAELPVHMECFDNSNIQGGHPVSACVVFRDARPSKKDYRRFNIRSIQGPNDFATMQEVLQRRYSRLLEEGEALPQLIIVDGGKGQLSAAVEALDQLGLRGKVAVIGIAKKLEEIYFPGDSTPIYLDKRSESLRIIQQMRDEAHRFGISHHRDRRSRDALRSELDDIPGVGPRTIQALMKHFRTVARIREAGQDELAQAVNSRMARLVYTHFHPGE